MQAESRFTTLKNAQNPTQNNAQNPTQNNAQNNSPTNSPTNTQRTMTNRMTNGMKNTGKILYDTGKKPFNMYRRYAILNLIDRHKLMSLLKQALNTSTGITENSLNSISLYDILKKNTNGKVNVKYIIETVNRHRNINNKGIEMVKMEGSGKKPTKKPVKKAPAKKPVKKATTKKSTTKKTTKKPVKKTTKKGGNISCTDWKAQGFNSKADCIESQR